MPTTLTVTIINTMNLLLVPIPLLFILQLFTSTVFSQGAAPTVSLIPPPVSASGSVTNSSSSTHLSTGTANSSISATATSTAQFPSLSGVSSCVSDCLAEGSARLNCSSVVDVNCFCVNSNYASEIVSCVLAMCPTEVTTIESLGQQFCDLASAHPTLSFVSIPTSSSGSTSSSSTSVLTSAVTPTSTSTPTPTSSATFSMSASAGLMGLGVVLVVGVVLGV